MEKYAIEMRKFIEYVNYHLKFRLKLKNGNKFVYNIVKCFHCSLKEVKNEK